MPRIEGNSVTNLGLYYLALGDPDKANYFARYAKYDSVLDPHTKGSVNIPIRYRVCVQDWDTALAYFEFFETEGWQLNEFNSSLYGESVFFSLCLASVLAPEPEPFRKLLRTWVAFLSLQSVVIRRPEIIKYDMGGITHTTKIVAGKTPSLWRPPTGMRTNPAAIAGSGGVNLLAEILNLPCRAGGRLFMPSEVAKTIHDIESVGNGLYMPKAHIYAIKDHLPQLRKILGGDLIQACRGMIDGHFWYIDALRTHLASIRLRSPMERFIVQRGNADRVLTAWSGRQLSVQKAYVVGASYQPGRLDYCIPCRWTYGQHVVKPCVAKFRSRIIEATADVTVTMAMISSPDMTVEFRVDQEPTITQ